MRKFDKQINELMETHGTCDPFLLADYLGFRIEYGHFNRVPLGQTIPPRHRLIPKPIIVLDETLKGCNDSFFVCAHELCHALNHDGLSSYYVANCVSHAKLEVEANRFAIDLAVAHYTHTHGAPPHYFEQLEQCYGVPDEFLDMYF